MSDQVTSLRDLYLSADEKGSGIGDLVMRVGGVERARLTAAGSYSGVVLAADGSVNAAKLAFPGREQPPAAPTSGSLVTNYVANGSFDIDTTGWSGITSGTVTRDATVYFLGRDFGRKTRAADVTSNGTAGSGARFAIPAATLPTNGIVYTACVMVFATGTGIGKQVMARARDHVTTTQWAQSVTLASGWQPITVQFTPTDVTHQHDIDICDFGGGGVSYAFKVAQVQVEQGRFSHPFVFTAGATATETQDDDRIWEGQERLDKSLYFGTDPVFNAAGCSFVTSPSRRGGQSLRLHNNAGDYDSGHTATDPTPRVHTTVNLKGDLPTITEGDELWFSFSVYIPSDFGHTGLEGVAGNNDFHAFADLHQVEVGLPLAFNQAPIALALVYTGGANTTPKIRARMLGGTTANYSANQEDFILCDYVENQWYDFAIHAKYTSDGVPGNSTGFIEMWVNGKYWPYGAIRYRPTMCQGFDSYWAASNYHSQPAGVGNGYASTVYFAEPRCGRSATSVGMPTRQKVAAELIPQWAAANNIVPANVSSGTLAARPAAAAGNTGYWYIATDDLGGTLYTSDGATWTEQLAGAPQTSVWKLLGTANTALQALNDVMIMLVESYAPWTNPKVIINMNAVDNTKKFDIAIHDLAWQRIGHLNATSFVVAGDYAFTYTGTLRRGAFRIAAGWEDIATSKFVGGASMPGSSISGKALHRQTGVFSNTTGIPADLSSPAPASSARGINYVVTT